MYVLKAGEALVTLKAKGFQRTFAHFPNSSTREVLMYDVHPGFELLRAGDVPVLGVGILSTGVEKVTSQ